MGFHFGNTFAVYAKMSVMSRSDCSGGSMYVPRAAYSFRMSIWIVPWRSPGATPCFSPTAW